jgi:hypothetical protein
VVSEFRHGVHHAEHSAEANHLIKTSGCLPQRREQLKASVPRVLIGLFEGHISPHLALRPRAIWIEWPCTRKEDYVSEPRRRYVVCDGRSDLRQFYPQFTQPRFGRSCGSRCAEAGVRYKRGRCKASDEYGTTIDVIHGFSLLS